MLTREEAKKTVCTERIVGVALAGIGAMLAFSLFNKSEDSDSLIQHIEDMQGDKLCKEPRQ